MKKQTMWRRVTAMMMCAVLLCGCCACSQTPKIVTYSATVQSEGGMLLEKVRVDVYRQGTDDRVWAGMTDSNGSVTFETSVGGTLEATVSELPAGYTAQERYTLDSETVSLVLQTAPVEGDLAAQRFTRGDIMCDFTVQTNDGDYTLSKLLETKKAVVLNFWFEGCGPCRAEFPYLQKAYTKYAQDVEVLAINPYDGTASSVAAYAKALGLTFPVAKGDEAWLSAMNLTSYPTTVVIDRYGMVSMIHQGSITGEGVFEAIFAYFTGDMYVQSAIRNVSELA